MLLVSAGLLLRSFVNVMGADRGYSVDRVMAVDLSLFGPRQDAAVFYRQLAENTRSLPGVQAAGVINDLPATAGSTGASRTIFHSTDTDFQDVVLKRPVAMIRSVTSGYFAASGTALRAGRHFRNQEPAPVALISESLARALWPTEPIEAAVGRTIRQGNVTGDLITVVGVAQDVRAGAVDRELPPVHLSAVSTMGERSGHARGSLSAGPGGALTSDPRGDPKVESEPAHTADANNAADRLRIRSAAQVSGAAYRSVRPRSAVARGGRRVRCRQLFRRLPNAGDWSACGVGRHARECLDLGLAEAA